MSAIKTNACYINEYPYDCDIDNDAHPSHLHKCAKEAMDCRVMNNIDNKKKKEPICGETPVLQKHPYDCDYIEGHNTSQRGFCMANKSHCFDNHEISNHSKGYRKQKKFGSIWLSGMKQLEMNRLRAESAMADAIAKGEEENVKKALHDLEIAQKELEDAIHATEQAEVEEEEESKRKKDAFEEAAEEEADDANKELLKDRFRKEIRDQILKSKIEKKDLLTKYFQENQNNLNKAQNEKFIKEIQQILASPTDTRVYSSALRMIDINEDMEEKQPGRMIDINYITENNQTALDLATNAGDYKLITFLKNRNALSVNDIQKGTATVPTSRRLKDVPDVNNYPEEWTTGYSPGQNGLDISNRYDYLPGNLENEGKTHTFVPHLEKLLQEYVEKKEMNKKEWMATCGTHEKGDEAYPSYFVKGQRLPFPSQKIFKWVLHPLSPIKRLLAVHTAGAGKTNMIADALSNYFTDPRAKIVVVPTQQHVMNIYSDLLKIHDNKMVEFLHKKKYKYLLDAVTSPKNDKAKNQALIDIIALFECKPPNPNPNHVPKIPLKYQKIPNAEGVFLKSDKHSSNDDALCAPIRVYNLKDFCTIVGKLKNNQSTDAFAFNWGNRDPRKSPLSNHILLIDEVHNMINPFSELFEGQAGHVTTRVENWKKTIVEIENAKNAVVIGFTATPIGRGETIESEKIDETVKKAQSRCKYCIENNKKCSWGKNPMSDAHRLFRMIKGKCNENANDKGFVSYYMKGMLDLFAKTEPPMQDLLNENPAGGRYGVEYIDMPHPSVEGTGKYYEKRRALCKGKPTEVKCQWAHNFNDDIRPTQQNIIGPSTQTGLSKNAKAITRRNKLSVEKIKNNAPKIHRALELINEHNPDEKILILANEVSGFHLMAYALYENKVPFIGIYAKNKNNSPVGCQYLYNSTNGFKKYADELSISDIESRDNTPASECRVIMLNSDKYSEGISVKNATLTICLSPLDNWSMYRQAFARGVRSCGHALFNKKDRLVKLKVLVATNQRGKADETAIDEMSNTIDNVDIKKMKVLELKKLCTQKNLQPPGGCNKTKKKELIELLQAQTDRSPRPVTIGGTNDNDNNTIGNEITIDEENLEKAIKDKPLIEGQLCWFKNQSIDENILHAFTDDNSCMASSPTSSDLQSDPSDAKECPNTLFVGDEADNRNVCTDWCKDEPRLYIKEDLYKCQHGYKKYKQNIDNSFLFRMKENARQQIFKSDRRTLKDRRKELTRKLRESDGTYTYKQYKKDYSGLYDEEYSETEPLKKTIKNRWF